MNFIEYDEATGEILYATSRPTNELPFILRPSGFPIENLPYYYVADGNLTPKGLPLSASDQFDYTTKQWIDPRTLSDRKQAKWSEIKSARSAAEFGGFTWDGSTFDSDQISQSRIQGAAQLAQLALAQSQPFTIDWTLADNTTRTLDAMQMIQVGVAMGQHIATCHAQARVLRAQLDAATTVEEVEAVAWGGVS